MNDKMNDPLDDLLREHFRSELDGQLGKAAKSFAAEVKRGRRIGAADAGRRLVIWGVWTAGAIAASVGIVWGFATRLSPVLPTVISDATTTSASNDPLPLQRVVESHSIDEGTILLGDAGPVRRVREQVIETTTFYDPESHAQLEFSVPRERMMLVGLHTY
jgi:hypothetical protein